MTSPIRIVCLLSAAILPLSVLEAGPSGKSERGLTVRVLADKVPDGQGKVIIQVNKKKSEPLDLPINQLSEPIPVAGRSMVLKAEEGEAALSTVTLPEDGKSFAVLLVSKEADGYTPFVIRTDDRTFKAGDVFFVNHTAKVIALKLGSTELVIEPGKSTISRPTKPENNSYQILISERSADGDSSAEKLVSSTRWPVDSSLRSYIFLTERADGKTTYRAVDEFLEDGKQKRR